MNADVLTEMFTPGTPQVLDIGWHRLVNVNFGAGEHFEEFAAVGRHCVPANVHDQRCLWQRGAEGGKPDALIPLFRPTRQIVMGYKLAIGLADW